MYNTEFLEERFGDVINCDMELAISLILDSEDTGPDQLIPTFTLLHDRLKQSSFLWNVNPYQRLWYNTNFNCFINHIF